MIMRRVLLDREEISNPVVHPDVLIYRSACAHEKAVRRALAVKTTCTMPCINQHRIWLAL
ncbi:hypothetical protein BD626DRAFT_526855 [Schizophyllum amplum]|uniref:Uncharacterized protein n=1 Tax=Schizophyllum amplum TaxID=97359 RepID=A0A550BSB0_9AGAR|nr:hypothetical protein BD626DRAFT_526855 [Auriculariopsis ampla]